MARMMFSPRFLSSRGNSRINGCQQNIGIGSARAMLSNCTCRKEHSIYPSPCVWIPRHRFASSRFNTLVLLVLRLFYQASSFDLAAASSSSRISTLKEAKLNVAQQRSGRNNCAGSKEEYSRTSLGFFSAYERLSTADWLKKVLVQSELISTSKVVSMTWVKALTSPFSHEFIQLIVEDSTTGQRTRIAVGREETGDWVICGWNWASGDPPSHHYTLPLPLLSLDFHKSNRPDIVTVSQLFAMVTERRPEYRLSREMCWWFAETIFEEMHSRYDCSIKEWKWAKYRYSFIVVTKLLQRRTLRKHAEAFREQIATEMHY